MYEKKKAQVASHLFFDLIYLIECVCVEKLTTDNKEDTQVYLALTSAESFLESLCIFAIYDFYIVRVYVRLYC